LTEQPPQFRHVEVKLPFILIKTRRGLNLMDSLSRSRVTRPLSNFYLYIMPVIAAVMIFIALFAIQRYLYNPQLGTFVRGLGVTANLLIPGLNPYLPIVYGWIALFTGLIVHEASHGVVARANGFTVKDSGLIFFLILPIGAFVELDEEELKVARPGVAGRILAAGAGSNILTAIISLALMLAIVSSMTPVAGHGLGVLSVVPGSPAAIAGLHPGDLLVSLNGTKFTTVDQLSSYMQNTTKGMTETFYYIDSGVLKTGTATLTQNPDEPNIGFLGITASDDPSLVLKNFLTISPLSISRYFFFPSLTPTQVPFTSQMSVFYSSPLGPAAVVFANLFFWIWFVNFNVALFNALPLGPFDGGVAFRHLLRAISHADWNDSFVARTSNIVTAIMAVMVLMLVIVPWIT
jgi:membrane-associated protease RseP (regulator of RpoE activity)